MDWPKLLLDKSFLKTQWCLLFLHNSSGGIANGLLSCMFLATPPPPSPETLQKFIQCFVAGCIRVLLLATLLKSSKVIVNPSVKQPKGCHPPSYSTSQQRHILYFKILYFFFKILVFFFKIFYFFFKILYFLYFIVAEKKHDRTAKKIVFKPQKLQQCNK
jgi:hypothetical protein